MKFNEYSEGSSSASLRGSAWPSRDVFDLRLKQTKHFANEMGPNTLSWPDFQATLMSFGAQLALKWCATKFAPFFAPKTNIYPQEVTWMH
jgi:hypothetical protein